MFLPNTCSVRKPTWVPSVGLIGLHFTGLWGQKAVTLCKRWGLSVCGWSFNSCGIVAMIWVVCYSGQFVPVHTFLLPRNLKPFCWVFCLLGSGIMPSCPLSSGRTLSRVLWLLPHYVVCTQVQNPPFRDELHPFLLSFAQFLCRGRQVSAPPVSLLSLCLVLSASLFSSATTPVPRVWPSPSTPRFPFSFSR